MEFWNDAHALSYIAMCVRMKLRKDQKALPTTDERVLERVKQGEKSLKDLYYQIAELRGSDRWGS